MERSRDDSRIASRCARSIFDIDDDIKYEVIHPYITIRSLQLNFYLGIFIGRWNDLPSIRQLLPTMHDQSLI